VVVTIIAAMAVDTQSIDPFMILPPELHMMILQYLSPRDLCRYERVHRLWKRNHTNILNEVWWRLCMVEWWSKKDRPKIMSRADKKKDWKTSFASICPHAAFTDNQVFVKDKSLVTTELVKAQNIQAPIEEKVVNVQAEMRAYYKSVRSKPKTKGGKREDRGIKRNPFLAVQDCNY